MALNETVTHIAETCQLNRKDPAAWEFWAACWDLQPELYGSLWASAVAVGIVCAIVSGTHLYSLWQMERSMQWALYSRIALYPVVLWFTSLFIVFAPRSYLLGFLLQIQWKAMVLRDFSIVISLLMFREGLGMKIDDWTGSDSRAPDTDTPDMHPKSVRALALEAQTRPIRAVMRAFHEGGKKKIFAALPLGCCFAPCMKERLMSPTDVSIASSLVGQFVYVTPLCCYVLVWAVLNLPCEKIHDLSLVLGYVITVSGIIAMYGLQITFQCAREVLHRWKPCQKFASFQVVIIMGIVQQHSTSAVAKWLRSVGGPCLQGQALEHFIDSWLLLPQALLMAIMMKYSFVAEDIIPFMGTHLHISAMELQVAPDLYNRPGSDSDSEDEDSGDSEAESGVDP